ncbi:RNA polymerase sigma-54 factor RpoN [hydrothermal vent metagenome]|uniref:RNA polymerase sigma-54 factor RpoN n=1 Tax=hydrothermal vent metagenome TaxID=652676 RepID=A0A3B1B0N5_9ZZZZ
MKQTLQLRLGQYLTMTPQLQQAIRLLQLSTLDLKQEIQDALDSNLMLEVEDEGAAQEPSSTASSDIGQESQPSNNDPNNEQEINAEADSIPEDLPTDSAWDDVYDSLPPPQSGTQRESGDTDFLLHRDNTQTLNDHLVWQMNLTIFSDTDLAIATAIIDAVDESGYLTGTLEDILACQGNEEIDLSEVEAVLHRIQSFDPPGVAARTPQECLLIQLRQLPDSTLLLEQAINLVENHFNLLARQDQNQIKQTMKLSDEEISQVNQLIRSLNPHPGSLIVESPIQYVIPDVFVFKKNGSWHIELNPDSTPRLRVNADYASMIKRADNSDDNVCLKTHLQEARWFIKSLLSRNDTLLRVATKIVEFQRPFFDYGEEAMKPLVLRDIAETLELHESTISRVTTQKYMHTPRGTLEFKYFFSSHVSTAGGGECSATAIRALIKKLVAAEKPGKPLSDNKIASILSEQGIKVARRTVAKYRESMAIPPSNERKRLV